MSATPRKSLSVLNPNDKVQQLRQAFADEGFEHKPSDASKIESAANPLESQIIDALRTIYDPEIPVNVYDLGLIYGIRIDDNQIATITMTLTAPACPVAGEVVANVQKTVQNVDGIKSCVVELVFEPQWTKDRMSEAALLELGLI